MQPPTRPPDFFSQRNAMRNKIVTTLWRSLYEILVIILLGSKSYAGAIASSFLHSHIPKDSQGDHKEKEHFV